MKAQFYPTAKAPWFPEQPAWAFALSDVLATTGSAPAEVFNEAERRFGLPLSATFGMPRVHYACPAAPDGAAFDLGDGGIVENLGVAQLLKRRVDRLVAVVNGVVPFDEDDDVAFLFGRLPRHRQREIERLRARGRPYKKSDLRALERARISQVFEAEGYDELIDATLRRNARGEPVWHRQRLRTVECPFFGVEAGQRVDVLWVFNEDSHGFLDQLDAEARRLLGPGKQLAAFPHIATFFENANGAAPDIPRVVDLTPAQANLLAELGDFNTQHVSARVEELLRTPLPVEPGLQDA